MTDRRNQFLNVFLQHVSGFMIISDLRLWGNFRSVFVEMSPQSSGVSLFRQNTTNRCEGGRFVVVISVKLSQGSRSERGGSRFTDSNNQELGGNRALLETFRDTSTRKNIFTHASLYV